MKEQKLIIISVLFLILFNFPIISIFNKGGNINGIPTLYMYVFFVWILFIIIIFNVLRKSSKENQKDEQCDFGGCIGAVFSLPFWGGILGGKAIRKRKKFSNKSIHLFPFTGGLLHSLDVLWVSGSGSYEWYRILSGFHRSNHHDAPLVDCASEDNQNL